MPAMVNTVPILTYYPSTSLAVEPAHAQKLFDDEEHGVPDEAILDRSVADSGLELSPAVGASRRDSFAMGSSVFSPKTEDWHTVDMQSIPSNNPFEQHSTNPYMRFDQTHTNPFSVPITDWCMTQGSASATPFPQFDGLTGDYETTSSILQRSLSNQQTPFAPNPSNMFGHLGNEDQSIPASPQKEWMDPSSKKMRHDSTAILSHNELRRGDGIRKKNARFEIPAERNLSNIDQLIAQSTDDTEVKELKQQKRLLRNRQAA